VVVAKGGKAREMQYDLMTGTRSGGR